MSVTAVKKTGKFERAIRHFRNWLRDNPTATLDEKVKAFDFLVDNNDMLSDE